MADTIIIQGPNITADIIRRLGDAIKPGDLGGTIVANGERYYWSSYKESPMPGAS